MSMTVSSAYFQVFLYSICLDTELLGIVCSFSFPTLRDIANLIPKMVVKNGGMLMKCECNWKRKTYLCHPWCSELTKTLGSRGTYKFQELAIHSLPANNQVSLIYKDTSVSQQFLWSFFNIFILYWSIVD